jgi:hypothetical protein
MLMDCAACGNNISSEAVACPKCGHPAARTAGTRPKKVSHISGWISLASFVLGGFSPAFMAPIFILVGLIFAGLEMNRGSKTFGVVMLCLTLVQGWWVIDHFGNVSSTLGITTAKDADAEAVAKYSNVDLNLPVDWRSIAESKCTDQWPTDYRMQQHCLERQEDGVRTLQLGTPAGIDPDAFRIIRGKCAAQWPRDFQMRAHCEEKQYEGYRAVKGSSVTESTRNVCADKWPDDYRMRQHCETRR